jgi:hypothetical protein
MRRDRVERPALPFPLPCRAKDHWRPLVGPAVLRIRDKIAASKKKGTWMGGNVPLGYDVKDRKLIVNEPEASIVRLIFKRYAVLGRSRCSGANSTGWVS